MKILVKHCSSHGLHLFLFSKVPVTDQSFNNFENDTLKVQVNEEKLTCLRALYYYSIGFDLKICLLDAAPKNRKK